MITFILQLQYSFIYFPLLFYISTNMDNICPCITLFWKESDFQKLLQNRILQQNLTITPCTAAHENLLTISFNTEARLAYVYFAVKPLPSTAANEN